MRLASVRLPAIAYRRPSDASPNGRRPASHRPARHRGAAGARVATYLPRILLALTAIAPVLWFRGGLPIKGVDSFFSLHPQGRLTTSLSAWDATVSAGTPTADLVTVIPNAIQASLGSLGVPIPVIQALFFVALAALGLAGMYRLAIEILPRAPRTEPWRRIVAAVVAIVWMTNPFALSFVWYHQLLTEMTWAVLPWLLWLLAVGVTGRRPMRSVVPAVVLTSVVGAAGFTHVLLVPVSALFLVVGLAMLWQAPDRRRAAGRGLAFFAAFLAGISWWVLPSLPALRSLIASAGVESSSLDQLRYASQFSSIPNVVSLTAVPQLYAKVAETPYVSWASLVTSAPGLVLRFALPITAVLGALAWAARSYRRTALTLLAGVAVAAMLSKGLAPPLASFNLALTNLPFGEAFRHPVDKFAVVLVPALCLLFGFGLLAALKLRYAGVAGLALATIAAGYLATPWWTGSVIPEGGGTLPSARVSMPPAYEVVGETLAGAPVGQKTMVLPYSTTGASAYRWRSGAQPNLDPLLQDWAPERTVIARVSGSSVPDLIGTTLADAILEQDPQVFRLAWLWGVDSWLVHSDWATEYAPVHVTPEAANRFLDPAGGPREAVPRDGRAYDLPSSAADVRLYVRTDTPPASEDRIVQLGSVQLQVNREGYFGLFDPERGLWDPALPPVEIGRWHRIDLSLIGGRIRLFVDRVPKGTGLPILGAPPAIQFLEPCPDCGRTRVAGFEVAANPSEATASTTSVSSFRPQPAVDRQALALYRQPALPVAYAATGSLTIPAVTSEALLAAVDQVDPTDRPVVVTPDLGLGEVALATDASTTWRRERATRYEGRLSVEGTTVLVLSQSFDPRWSLTVDGRVLPPEQHVLVNGFANGWIVNGSGTVEWVAEYTPQRIVDAGTALGATLALGSGAVIAADAVRRRRRRRRRARGTRREGRWGMRARLGFYAQYVVRKTILVWFEVRSPKVRMFLYEVLHAATRWRGRGRPLVSPFDVARVETRFGRFRIRPRTPDLLSVSPAYERPDLDRLLAIIEERLATGRRVLFVDVGAGVGTYTVAVGNRFIDRDGLLIVALEPAASSNRLLRDNIRRNGLDDVARSHRVALDATDGRAAALWIDDDDPGAAHLSPRGNGRARRRELVITRTLDAVLAGTTSRFDTLVMKIDVEGSEVGVLEGARETLASVGEAVLLVEDFVDGEIVRRLRAAGAEPLGKRTPYNSWWRWRVTPR